jgi:hypothetical protein
MAFLQCILAHAVAESSASPVQYYYTQVTLGTVIADPWYPWNPIQKSSSNIGRLEPHRWQSNCVLLVAAVVTSLYLQSIVFNASAPPSCSAAYDIRYADPAH